jgi:hypothetical protein
MAFQGEAVSRRSETFVDNVQDLVHQRALHREGVGREKANETSLVRRFTARHAYARDAMKATASSEFEPAFDGELGERLAQGGPAYLKLAAELLLRRKLALPSTGDDPFAQEPDKLVVKGCSAGYVRHRSEEGRGGPLAWDEPPNWPTRRVTEKGRAGRQPEALSRRLPSDRMAPSQRPVIVISAGSS